jgi:dTDP-4-dehydrorhamnose reductase
MVVPRILITGSTGQVGWECARALTAAGEVYAPQRDALDLAQTDSIRRAVRSFQPHWIVNSAAYTAVDKAESEPELAFAINRDAVAVIAEEAKQLGAVVVHYSTDYVFDGSKQAPYGEEDAASPVSVYGKSKLAGEQELAASAIPYFNFRTSWVYGPRGKNFLLTILKLSQERSELRIVNDQHGAPTWSYDLAALTAQVIRQVQKKAGTAGCTPAEAAMADRGTYHACNSGETTWHGFASEALRLLQQRQPEVRLATLTPIPTAEYPTPARRPGNSRLDCSKLRRQLGIVMPEWKESLQKAIAEVPPAK